MIFKTLNGSTKRIKKPKNHLIKWAAPSRSKFQFNVKQFLEKYWKSDMVFEELPLAGSRMSFDFYNATQNIAIEVQGQQHTKYTPFFHGKAKSNFLGQIRRDNDKQKYCEINKIKLIEVYPKDQITEESMRKLGLNI
jgi:hypothetical protein